MQQKVATSVLDLDASGLRWQAGSRPAAPQVGVRIASVRSAGFFVALLAGIAVLAVQDAGSGRPPLLLVPAAGVASLAVLLASSASERVQRPMAGSSVRDPFVLFATAIGLVLAPWSLELLTADGLTEVSGSAWTSAFAGGLVAAGILLMIAEMAPGRVVDAVYLSSIGALGIGLMIWVGLPLASERSGIAWTTDAAHLLPVVVDLAVVGLALHAVRLPTTARPGCRLLVVGWSAVLVAHASNALTHLAGAEAHPQAIAAAWILGLGFIGAAALHPSTARVAEPMVGSLDRLPRSQVVFVGTAVALIPIVVALGTQSSRSLPTVVLLCSSLGVLVVGYLVRVVQGHASFEHSALHDGLTGLPNRRLFEERVAGGIARARRTGGHTAMLFVDLDRFKSVNDTLGHAAGNLLLKAVARRLQAACGSDETVARLGGDEFVIFLPEVDKPSTATSRAREIMHRFAEPFSLNGSTVHASPSIGVAVSPRDGDDADSLLDAADAAMYRAKQNGRSMFCAFEPSMKTSDHDETRLGRRLHEAIEHGELRLHYQPKFQLHTGRMTGMEALLRWEHPELGLLPPSEFIPIAEETGLIVPMGEWALEEACRQNQAWTEAGFERLVVAVNLSLRQFQQQHIGSVVARVLRATGLDPCLLELEVTESLALQDPESVRGSLTDLREIGVQCSIDDFGTGYSGLSQLTQLPVDKLKIDKSFVATLDTDGRAPVVVAVVALARGLGLAVVAEGVETEVQLQRLRELGCDEMQGFLLSRPLPAHDFELLLASAANSWHPTPAEERRRSLLVAPRR